MNEGRIYQAIPAIMAEIQAIGKDRENTSQGYKFRGIDDVYNELHPLLAKHKIFTVPEVLEEKDETVTTQKGNVLFYRLLKIRYTFYADDGSSVVAVVRGEGMDSGDKASNKAMAGAHKYALVQMFAIPTDEPKDAENDSPEIVIAKTPDERAHLRGRYKALFQSGFFTPADKTQMDAEIKAQVDNLPSLKFLIEKFEGELAQRKLKDDEGASKAWIDNVNALGEKAIAEGKDLF